MSRKVGGVPLGIETLVRYLLVGQLQPGRKVGGVPLGIETCLFLECCELFCKSQGRRRPVGD